MGLPSHNIHRAKQNAAGVYVRHRPETTLLYQIVQEYWPEFQVELASYNKYLPAYGIKEFDEHGKGCLTLNPMSGHRWWPTTWFCLAAYNQLELTTTRRNGNRSSYGLVFPIYTILADSVETLTLNPKRYALCAWLR